MIFILLKHQHTSKLHEISHVNNNKCNKKLVNVANRESLFAINMDMMKTYVMHHNVIFFS